MAYDTPTGNAQTGEPNLDRRNLPCLGGEFLPILGVPNTASCEFDVVYGQRASAASCPALAMTGTLATENAVLRARVASLEAYIKHITRPRS